MRLRHIAFLSAFVNNVGAMALLMPVAIQLSARHELTPGKVLPYQRPMAIGLAAVLVVEAAYLLLVRNPSVATIIPPTEATNTVGVLQDLGMTLFNQYLLPFEVTSILLLVAMVGAIVLTKQEKKGEQK